VLSKGIQHIRRETPIDFQAHAALPKGGALIVCEAIIHDERWQTRLACS